MKLATSPPVHLTYCLNVHPGETWEENLAAIRTHALAVKRMVCPDSPFGLGLRLSARAAAELACPEALDFFKDFLSENSLYVFTVNAFSFGLFHGARVKENVYGPDWRSKERLSYTVTVSKILGRMTLPENFASVSTVPGSYGAWIKKPEDEIAVSENLARYAAAMAALEDETGNRIALALEPEPDCLMESADGLVRFFSRRLVPAGERIIAKELSCSIERAREKLFRHIGVCLDTCHMAVCFEDAIAAISLICRNNIGIFKVQISAAPVFSENLDLGRILSFSDSVYLHQARLLSHGNIERFADIEDVCAWLEKTPVREAELRIHCHLPIFFAGDENIATTAGSLSPEIFFRAREAGCRHFEVETYTFNVLPPEFRQRPVAESIADEIRFARRLIL